MPALAAEGVSHFYGVREALLSLAVVCGCRAVFMIGAILAYDPARGLLARRGGDA